MREAERKRNRPRRGYPSTRLWDYRRARMLWGRSEKEAGFSIMPREREEGARGDVALTAVILITATGGAVLRYYSDVEPHLGVSRDFRQESGLGLLLVDVSVLSVLFVGKLSM